MGREPGSRAARCGRRTVATTKLLCIFVSTIVVSLSYGCFFGTGAPRTWISGYLSPRPRSVMSSLRAHRPGAKVSGIVKKRLKGGLIVLTGGDGTPYQDLFIPKFATPVDKFKSYMPKDKVDLWVMTVSAKGDRGTMREDLAMTAEKLQKFKKAATAGERLRGVVERAWHPWAEIKVMLEDGTSALGGLHVKDLGKGFVADIREQLSDGEPIWVNILHVSDRANQGRMTLSAADSSSAIETEALPPLTEGIQTSGTVTRLSMAGDFVVKLVDKRFVLVPSRFGVPPGEEVNVGDAVKLWIMTVSENGTIGTFREELAMSREKRSKFESAALAGERLGGVVERLRHPWADILVTLADGTSALGNIHFSRLRKGNAAATDISELLSVGDAMVVKILDASNQGAPMKLAELDAEFDPGQEVHGTIKSHQKAGLVVQVGGVKEVLIPWEQGGDSYYDSPVGTPVGPLWIVNAMLAPGRSVGTLRRGKAMTQETEGKMLEAMEKGTVFNGVVKRLRHPLANVVVSLEDGTSVMGSLHFRQLGVARNKDIHAHLSLGQRIPVTILNVSNGIVSLTGHSSLVVGQEVHGTVKSLLKQGIVVRVGGGDATPEEEVLLPWREGADAIESLTRLGRTIGPMYVLRIRPNRDRTVASIWPERVVSPLENQKFAEAMEQGDVVDGVVKHLTDKRVYLAVTLQDGTTAMGTMHAEGFARKWGQGSTDAQPVGESVSVRITEVDPAGGLKLAFA